MTEKLKKKSSISILFSNFSYSSKLNFYKSENKRLKEEIKDLKISLKLHKEILDQKCEKDNADIVNELLKQKLRFEKDINDLKNSYYEKFVSNESEIEKIKTKLFICENQIKEKDNIILLLKEKKSEEKETKTEKVKGKAHELENFLHNNSGIDAITGKFFKRKSSESQTFLQTLPFFENSLDLNRGFHNLEASLQSNEYIINNSHV